MGRVPAGAAARAGGHRVWLALSIMLLVVVSLAGAGSAYWLLVGDADAEARAHVPARSLSAPIPSRTPSPQPSPSAAPPVQNTSAPPDLPPRPGDFSALFEELKSGVVMIRATTCDGEGVGSGFLVSPSQIVTAAHVVDGAASVAVMQAGTAYTAEVVGVDADIDVALLRVDRPLQAAHIFFDVSHQVVKAGATVAVIGHPLGAPITITEGNASRVDEDLWPNIQLDVSVSPGNSGGPVVDQEGAVVGVLVARDTEAEGLAYAVRSDLLGEVVDGSHTLRAAAVADCENPLGPEDGELPAIPTSEPLSEAITATFADYFGGINRGDYRLAYDRLSPRLRNGYENFAEGVSTSFDFDFKVTAVTPTPQGADVWLRFVSLQDPAFGPDGESCTQWSIDYSLIRAADGEMVIDSAKGHSGDGHTQCR